MIRGAASVFDADVEVRNQARVHLWYEDKWGVTCPPHASTEAAIATFPATAACIGVRLKADGGLHLHTAYGTEDLLALVVRPNRVLAPREVYEAKVARWVSGAAGARRHAVVRRRLPLRCKPLSEGCESG